MPLEDDDTFARYVNPFIGTDYTGNTYPGVQVPFGMVQISPDNGFAGSRRMSGYFYPDTTISGFSHTHLSGTMTGSLHDISFMPVTLPCKVAPAPLGIYSHFSHANEAAGVGYYYVLLDDYNIAVELTATARCGIQRYTFPEANSAVLLNLDRPIDNDLTVDTHLEIVDSVTIQGYRVSDGWMKNRRVYFRTRFSRPFDAVRLDTLPLVQQGKRTGTAITARFDFRTRDKEEILLYTALSGVSMEGAARNLATEAIHSDFNEYAVDTREEWDELLGKIIVRCNDNNDRIKFYTALYHVMLAPHMYNDVDGIYSGADGKKHRAYGWNNYGMFSLEATHWVVYPLYAYIVPESINNIVKSLLAFYRQVGHLPVWSILDSEVGEVTSYHAASIIADAFLKNIGNFNPEEALRACVSTARQKNYRLLRTYRGDTAGVAALQSTYDDYSIARMAEQMGYDRLAGEFDLRAQHRHSFRSAQHDVEGLIGQQGGAALFTRKLDSLFSVRPADKQEIPSVATGIIGEYVHGNPSDQHIGYLYNAVRQPWKTQEYVSHIMHHLYRNAPAGLCDTDDFGQLSAWFVFSAMGFYPVDPLSGRYEIGSPLFPEVRILLPNHKVFTVLAHDVDKKNIYVQSVRLNGQPYHQSYITHEQIMSGSVLELDMGDTPGEVWY
jgi:predicted alpha-1,2-mannosidase